MAGEGGVECWTIYVYRERERCVCVCVPIQTFKGISHCHAWLQKGKHLFMYLTCNNWPQEIDDAFHTRSTPSFPAKEMRPILLILGEEHLTGLNSNTCHRWRYQVLVCICSIYMYYSMYKNKFLWYPEFPACSFLNLWLHGWSHHCAEGPDERLAICHSGRASWLAQIFSRAKYDYINWNITIKHVCSTNIYSFVYIICIFVFIYIYICICICFRSEVENSKTSICANMACPHPGNPWELHGPNGPRFGNTASQEEREVHNGAGLAQKKWRRKAENMLDISGN